MIDLTLHLDTLSTDEGLITVSYCREQDTLTLDGARIEVGPGVLEEIMHVLLKEIHGKVGEAISAFLDRLPDAEAQETDRLVIPALQRAADEYSDKGPTYARDYTPRAWPDINPPSKKRPAPWRPTPPGASGR